MRGGDKRKRTESKKTDTEKQTDVAKKAGEVGAKTAIILHGVTKNAAKQVFETKDKLLDIGTGAAKKGKRWWNKIQRSVKGQILSATNKLIPTYTEKQVDNLEKKLSNKVAKVGADSLEAGGNIVKNIHTNPKLQRQAKKLAKNTLAAAKDGAEVAIESAGNLAGPVKKVAGAAAGVAEDAAGAAATVGIGMVKEAAFAVPGVADVYNAVDTGLQLGDQAVKGATKVGKMGVEAGKLGNAAADEVMDIVPDAMAGITKVKKLAASAADLAEDAVEPPKKKRRTKKGGGRKTRRKRRRRRRRRSRKRRKYRNTRRFRRRRKRTTRRR